MDEEGGAGRKHVKAEGDNWERGKNKGQAIPVLCSDTLLLSLGSMRLGFSWFCCCHRFFPHSQTVGSPVPTVWVPGVPAVYFNQQQE